MQNKLTPLAPMEQNTSFAVVHSADAHIEISGQRFKYYCGAYPRSWIASGLVARMHIGTLAVSVILGDHANRYTGRCCLKVSTIAAESGKSERTVRYGLKALERAHAIRVFRSPGHASEYQLLDVAVTPASGCTPAMSSTPAVGRTPASGCVEVLQPLANRTLSINRNDNSSSRQTGRGEAAAEGRAVVESAPQCDWTEPADDCQPANPPEPSREPSPVPIAPFDPIVAPKPSMEPPATPYADRLVEMGIGRDMVANIDENRCEDVLATIRADGVKYPVRLAADLLRHPEKGVAVAPRRAKEAERAARVAMPVGKPMSLAEIAAKGGRRNEEIEYRKEQQRLYIASKERLMAEDADRIASERRSVTTAVAEKKQHQPKTLAD